MERKALTGSGRSELPYLRYSHTAQEKGVPWFWQLRWTLFFLRITRNADLCRKRTSVPIVGWGFSWSLDAESVPGKTQKTPLQWWTKDLSVCDVFAWHSGTDRRDWVCWTVHYTQLDRFRMISPSTEGDSRHCTEGKKNNFQKDSLRWFISRFKSSLS